MITTACGACGKSHRVKPEMVGKKARCTCGSIFAIAAIAPPDSIPLTPASSPPTLPPSPAPAPTISHQVREGAWVVAGFGWFFLVCCCFSALFCTGSALDGSLAGWDSAEIAFVIIGTAALNAVAIGFIALGKPENLAALFPTVAAGPTLPGSLGNRFRLFGNVTGRTRAEITSAVGRPVAVTAMATNTVIQWSERGYQIALFFDGSTDGALCQGIASEIGI